jgi:site-specific DNA-methyltransferase (cytosine-N4-specific)
MEPPLDTCLFGDCLAVLRTLPDGFVQTCVTSPPYFGLRDYGHAGQIGLEATPDAFVARLVEVFREVRRVLKDDGTLWLNLGDSYAASRGSKSASNLSNSAASNAAMAGDGGGMRAGDFGLKPKDLIGIPWMVAFALRADGWWLRQELIWHKPNPMPESVTDRCTKAHEQIFLLAKAERYFFDHEAIKEPSVSDHLPGNHTHKGATAYAQEAGEHHRTKAGLVAYAQRQRAKRPSVERGGFGGKTADQPGREAFRAVTDTRHKRSVWTVATKPYGGAHFAVFPTALIEPCVLAGSRPGDVVLDPFFGSGTCGAVAQALGRRFLGIEINEAYAPLQAERLRQPSLNLEAA